MYINSNTRPFLDKEIESLAQVISKNTREGVPTYGVAGALKYAISKLLARVLKIKYKEINDVSVDMGISALEGASQEFHRRIVSPFNDKQKSLNGDCFGEIL